MSNLPLLSKLRKKCYHHIPLLLVKNDHQLSILWFLVEGTQWCAFTSCLKYAWSAAAKTFSVPKSVKSLIRHPWNSVTQSKFNIHIVKRNGKIVWKCGRYCWYFPLILKYLGWPYREYTKAAKNGGFCQDCLVKITLRLF